MSQKKRPPLEKWYSYILFTWIGYCLADLTLLSYRDLMLPTQAPPARPKPRSNKDFVSRGAYGPITTRNVFSPDGVIPDPWRPAGDTKDKSKQQDIPIPSQLPLNLVGTMVHSNPDKSIAAIELKGKNQVISYMNHKEIETMAVIEKIERLRVYIRNNSTGGLEYIEMKGFGGKLSFAAPTKAAAPVSESGPGVVKKTGDNEFTLKRADLDKYTSNLSDLLMQARAVPNRDPNTGEINGFRLIDYQPNSIFAQLGIPKMALIKDVDGTPVTSPATAMELYNTLKNNNKISLKLEVNGQVETYRYNIK